MVQDVRVYQGATHVRVSCRRRAIPTSAGSYYYVVFPGHLFRYSLLHSRPLMVLWRHPDQVSAGAGDLTFLISHQDRHRHAFHWEPGQRLLLDGPYGRDLGFHHYETVILAAKGIGIAGVLASALHLLERHKHDVTIKKAASKTSKSALFRDTTRKVDVFWTLEHPSQVEWVASELRSLQALDDNNVGSRDLPSALAAY